MINYFRNKKKSFATFIVAWTVFLNLSPLAVLAATSRDEALRLQGIALQKSESESSLATLLGVQVNLHNEAMTLYENGDVSGSAAIADAVNYFNANNRVRIQAVLNRPTSGPGSVLDPNRPTSSDSSGILTLEGMQQQQQLALFNQYQQYLALGEAQEAARVDALYQSIFPTATGLNTLAQLPGEQVPGALGIDTNLTFDSTGTQGIGEGQSDPGAPDAGSLAEQTLTSVGTCSIGAILGRLLSSLIGQMVNAILNFITNTLLGIVSGALDCLLRPFQVCDTNPAAENQLSSIGEKETGESVRTVTGLAKFFKGISLDSIMFCIINEIMIYITQSTIAWINSGFEGNPVFIQNPEALFQRIAAQEAGNFIYTTANGVQNAVSSGVHQSLGAVSNEAARLTGNLGNAVTMGLIGRYNSSGFSSNPYLPSPTLSNAQISNLNFQNFGTQSQIWDYRNTPYGRAAFLEGPAMDAQIIRQQYISGLQYQTQGGYYNNTACPPGQERLYDFSCRPNALLTTVPGGQVKDEFNLRNLSKYMRVATANSFDAIVTALVNQLMKIAITKIFETEQKVNGAIQGAIQQR